MDIKNMENLTWKQFTKNVQQWAEVRGIYEHSTVEAQALKALSELGELADAVTKDDREGIRDGIGDVAVCLVNYGTMISVDFDRVPFDDSKELFGQAAPAVFIGMVAQELSVLLSPGRGLTVKSDSTRHAIGMLTIAAHDLGVVFLDCCTHAWNEIKDRTGRMVEGGAFVKDE